MSCLIALMDSLNYPHETFGSQISPDMSRSGIGVGDDWRLARLIHQRFAYTNTFLDRFPQLDLCDIPEIADSKFEFVICSDVLEHVRPPVSRAMDGLYRLVRPGGFAIVTVPLFNQPDAAEFYPQMINFELTQGGALVWTDNSQLQHFDENPDFHEGEGLVLVFRQFSAETLIADLKAAGFDHVDSPATLPPIAGKSVAHTLNNVFVARKGAV